MKRFVAFLRGMNVGGRRIKNDELCACFVAMGFADVSGFLASGNIIFSTRKKADTLEHTISKALEDALGYSVPSFVRTDDEVRKIAARQPFSPDGKIQVALLPTRPSRTARQRVLALATKDDRLAIHGRELFWLPRATMSESELDLPSIEAEIGPMTVRTKRTLERIAKKVP